MHRSGRYLPVLRLEVSLNEGMYKVPVRCRLFRDRKWLPSAADFLSAFASFQRDIRDIGT